MTRDQSLAGKPISRRTLLTGVGGLALTSSIGLDLLASAPAYAAGPTTAADMIQLARSCLGKRLADLNLIVGPPWAGYDADWCAWFVSWLLRGLGRGELTWVHDMHLLGASVSSPAPGDIMVQPTYHTGIVSAVSGSSVTFIEGNPTSTADGQKPPYDHSYVVERAKWGSPIYYRPAYTGVGNDMPERYGYLASGSLWVKEGNPTAGAILLEGNVVDFAMASNRIAIVYASGDLAIKEGGLDAGWVLLEGNIKSVALDGQRIAAITNAGTLIMKDGAIDSGWVTEEGNVAQVALSGNRVGIRYVNGQTAVKEGSLSAGWVPFGYSAIDIALGGNRIGIVQPDGTALVKEGAITVGWVTVQGAVNNIALTQNRIAVRSSAGVLQVKTGSISAGWSTWRTDAADLSVSGDKVGVVTNSGDAVVWDDSYGSGWVTLQGLTSRIVVAN